MKVKKNQSLVVILVGLLILISGTSALLYRNFNIIGQSKDHGILVDFDVVGDYAYVSDYGYGLVIIDISDPTAPVKVGEYPIDTYNEFDVSVSGSHAYMTGASESLEIIDISDPTAPVKVGEYLIDIEWVPNVYVSEDYAYVTGCSGGLEIINISNSTSPSEVGRFPDGEWASDVHVVGDYAYLECFSDDSNGFDGLQIVNISNPTNPVMVGQYSYVNTLSQRDFYVSGSYVYLTEKTSDFLEIIDISDPTDPVKVGQVADCSGTNDIYVLESNIYLAVGSDGLKVIDSSDPTAATEIEHIRYGGETLGVYAIEDYVFITDYSNGIVVIDLWSPRENISNIIFWSILGILILLALVDIRYLSKRDKSPSKESKQVDEPIVEDEIIGGEMKKMTDDDGDKMSGEEMNVISPIIDKKQRIVHFFIGLIVSYVTIGISILLIIGDSNIHYIIRGLLFSIIPLGILIIAIIVSLINKYNYIIMGMIAAILGPAFLLIKRNEDSLVEPYSEQPEKKKSHLIIGIFVSIGLLILYSPILFIGFIYLIWGDLSFIGDIIGISFIILVMNVLFSVQLFFSKEKFKYISKGMLLPVIIVSSLTILILLISEIDLLIHQISTWNMYN